MKNKTSIPKSFHDIIRTAHVFNEEEQVFLKKEKQEPFLEGTTVAEWFPTDFKWVPAQP